MKDFLHAFFILTERNAELIQVIRNILQEEIVFAVSALLAAVTSLFVTPSIKAVDLKVIFSLLNLMLISVAFEEYGLLDGIAVNILGRVRSERRIGLVMIFTTAGLGMLMTNDVALLTVVPVTIAMAKKAGFDPIKVIVLETAAANIGSSFTPFGNPQNLYLYNFFRMNTREFFAVISPFVAAGMLALLFVNLGNSTESMNIELEAAHLRHKRRMMYYGGLFILVILSVLRVTDYRIITAAVVVSAMALDRRLIKRVDYYLLGTFVSFFIFVDNVTRLSAVNILARSILDSPLRVFGISALLSQVISNVPAAILVSGFTPLYKEVLLGVSVGGIGTLVASLANLISYKIYSRSYAGKQYRRSFHRLNAALFVFLSAFVILYSQAK